MGIITFCPLAQMALAWILRDGDITGVLIGAFGASQIPDNTGMLKKTNFSEEERAKIEEIPAGQMKLPDDR